MECKKLFDEITKILYVWVNGDVDLDDMLKLQDTILDEDYLPSELRILEISTNTTSLLSINDVELAINAMLEKTRHFKSVRHAVIHNSPINTAHTMLADIYVDKDYYVIKVFSTVEAAKIWLMMN